MSKIRRCLGLTDRFQLLSSTFAAQALRILTTIVMARWLTPKDYGLVGLISAVPGIVSSLGDFGALRCLIQIRDLPDREVRDTALALSFGLSAIYAAVAVGCGTFLGFAYHDSRLVWLAGVQGLTGMLGMVYAYQLANLSRDLMFGAESKQNLFFAGCQAVSGIVFAVLGFGVFALVLQALVAQVVANLLIRHRFALGWPRHFSRPTFARYWQLGWRISLSQYLNNIQGSLINLTVGFVAGPVALGQYGRATQIRELVGQNILNSFDRLLFSLFADAQHDAARLRNQFLRGCTTVNLVSSLGGVGLCVCGRDVIRLLLGPQWDTAGRLLQILSASLFFNGLSLPAIVLVQALGKPLVWGRFAAANLVLLGGVLVAGKWYGLDGLSVGLVVLYAAFSVGFFVWAVRFLAVSWAEALRPVFTVWAGAVLGLIATTALRTPLAVARPPLVSLACLGTVGGGSFLVGIWLIDRQLLAGIVHLIFNRRTAPRKRAPVYLPRFLRCQGCLPGQPRFLREPPRNGPGPHRLR